MAAAPGTWDQVARLILDELRRQATAGPPPGPAVPFYPPPPYASPAPPGATATVTVPRPTPPAAPSPPVPAQTTAAATSATAGLRSLTRALADPVSALERLGNSGSRLAPAFVAMAAAARTFGVMRGLYGGVQGIMERGNPNMAGQMQGTLDLVSNRLAGVLSAPTQQVNAGIQGTVSGKPGATIGGGIGMVTLGALGFAAGLPIGMPMAGMGIGMAAGWPTGSAIGSWAMGEKALPSMAGLPQPSMHASGADWLESMQMRSLSVQGGTVEAENLTRQVQLMSEQLGGLLTRIENNTRSTYR